MPPTRFSLDICGAAAWNQDKGDRCERSQGRKNGRISNETTCEEVGSCRCVHYAWMMRFMCVCAGRRDGRSNVARIYFDKGHESDWERCIWWHLCQSDRDVSAGRTPSSSMSSIDDPWTIVDIYIYIRVTLNVRIRHACIIWTMTKKGSSIYMQLSRQLRIF